MAEEKSFNRRMLDATNALLENRATTDVIEFANTSGIDIKKETFDSLMRRKKYFERLVAREDGSYMPFSAVQLESKPY
jgi:hypothetical protein